MAYLTRTTVAAALAGLVCSAGCLSASAQTDPAMLLTPWQDENVAQLSTQAFYTPTQANITGADVDLAIFDASGRFRLDPASTYNPTIGFNFTQFNIDTTDAALPDRLIDMDVSFGGMFGYDLGESLAGKWQFGYTLGVGYAGTAPFNDAEAGYITANVFALKVFDKDSRLLIGINYDGNRVFAPDAPLPAVTYFGRLSDTVTYGLGFPFSSLTWKPDDKWTLDIRSALFFSFSGKVTYKASPRLSFFAAYLRRSEAFTLSNTIDNRRLLFSQQKAELGVSYALDSVPGMAITLAGGYAFGQEFDFGYDVRDPRGVRDLDDSAYLRLGITLGF